MPAHKAVLAAGSPYFAALLRPGSPWSAAGSREVATSHDPAVLRAVLAFVYTGALDEAMLEGQARAPGGGEGFFARPWLPAAAPAPEAAARMRSPGGAGGGCVCGGLRVPGGLPHITGLFAPGCRDVRLSRWPVVDLPAISRPQLDGLRTLAEGRLSAQLSAESVVPTLRLAALHCSGSLKAACFAFMRRNAPRMLTQRGAGLADLEAEDGPLWAELCAALGGAGGGGGGAAAGEEPSAK